MSEITQIAPHGGTLVNLVAEGAEADALRSEAANLPTIVVSGRESYASDHHASGTRLVERIRR